MIHRLEFEPITLSTFKMIKIIAFLFSENFRKQDLTAITPGKAGLKS